MEHMICFCYRYTEVDIVADIMSNPGRSSILEKIIAAKKAGDCLCSEKHPESR